MKPCSILGGKAAKDVQKLELESFVGNGFRGSGQRKWWWVVYRKYLLLVVALRTP
jgi:hypothetical protein